MRIKVLIIDDELMICKSLEAGLSDMGYVTEIALNKEDALMKVRTLKPDVVLTDMRLGKDNGIDLIDDIKRFDNDIEVVVMTAYSDIASAVLAIKKERSIISTSPLNWKKSEWFWKERSTSTRSRIKF